MRCCARWRRRPGSRAPRRGARGAPPGRRAPSRPAGLDRAASILAERRDEVLRTLAQEAGKPVAAAGVEVDRAVQTLTFSAVEARRLGGEVIGMDAHPAGAGKLGLVLRLPIGIVG